MAKGIQTLMAQGWSTKIISMLEWIRTSRLSIENSISLYQPVRDPLELGGGEEQGTLALEAHLDIDYRAESPGRLGR